MDPRIGTSMISKHHVFWRRFSADIRSRRLGPETQPRASREIAMQARRRADRDLGIF